MVYLICYLRQLYGYVWLRLFHPYLFVCMSIRFALGRNIHGFEWNLHRWYSRNIARICNFLSVYRNTIENRLIILYMTQNIQKRLSNIFRRIWIKSSEMIDPYSRTSWLDLCQDSELMKIRIWIRCEICLSDNIPDI